MTDILKVTTRWDGFQGAPGYSNFYWHEQDPGGSFDLGASAAADAVVAFFTAIKGLFPTGLKWRVMPDVPVINDANGDIVNYASAGTRADIAATAAASGYSAASGAVVTWRSSGVRNGHRVRGRTFLVPGAFTIMDTDGSIVASALTTLNTAATAYINTVGERSPVVWARPTAPGATDGAMFPIITASIPDKVAVLKSRRD